MDFRQLVAFENHTGYPVISCANGKAIVIEKILTRDNQLIDAQQILSSTKIRLTELTSEKQATH